MSVIANTTIISNFATIGQVGFLHDLFEELFISADVYEEIQEGIDEGYAFYRGITSILFPFNSDGWISVTGLNGEREIRLFGELRATLHAGEASCLAIAAHRRWTILTDDRAARSAARRLGVRLSGTVGILVQGVERRVLLLEQANEWLEAMTERGYYSPVTDLTRLIS